MKNLVFVAVLLWAGFSFGQIKTALKGFNGLDSNIGANIHVVKSSDYGMEISGDTGLINSIIYNIHHNNLKIRSSEGQTDYSQVLITVYTPSLEIMEITNGGRASLDKNFSRIASFEVSASDGAVVDLTQVEFKSLVAQSSGGGEVLYKSNAQTPQPSPLEEKVRSIQ
ncbi:GIN domain-containing protein [Poritiphilus flavus]|uniref:Putative auto-transporter adhesin head GIN domain-containing protein n=1 Tax=Poritiphilus flavus TaxID=2697053 RepID=A0A6L9EG75_9FLAO|nr:DUF2807 domain-containing protein [Poritiphilus flavus]NAS13518.1 hypothetical protein [Poritiphilus flavus]